MLTHGDLSLPSMDQSALAAYMYAVREAAAQPSPTFPYQGADFQMATYETPRPFHHEVKRRRRLTPEETRRLNEVFTHHTTKPDANMRQKLAEELGMTARGVQVWFQNRRAKVKRERDQMKEPLELLEEPKEIRLCSGNTDDDYDDYDEDLHMSAMLEAAGLSKADISALQPLALDIAAANALDRTSTPLTPASDLAEALAGLYYDTPPLHYTQEMGIDPANFRSDGMDISPTFLPAPTLLDSISPVTLTMAATPPFGSQPSTPTGVSRPRAIRPGPRPIQPAPMGYSPVQTIFPILTPPPYATEISGSPGTCIRRELRKSRSVIGSPYHHPGFTPPIDVKHQLIMEEAGIGIPMSRSRGSSLGSLRRPSSWTGKPGGGDDEIVSTADVFSKKVRSRAGSRIDS